MWLKIFATIRKAPSLVLSCQPEFCTTDTCITKDKKFQVWILQFPVCTKREKRYNVTWVILMFVSNYSNRGVCFLEIRPTLSKNESFAHTWFIEEKWVLTWQAVDNLMMLVHRSYFYFIFYTKMSVKILFLFPFLVLWRLLGIKVMPIALSQSTFSYEHRVLVVLFF